MGDRGALQCRWNVIATQPLGLVTFQARGILPVAEEQVVLYNGLKVEGPIVGGGTVQKRNIIQLANLHAQVVQKTANIIDSKQSMDIYSLNYYKYRAAP